jgi:hypothetical protein
MTAHFCTVLQHIALFEGAQAQQINNRYDSSISVGINSGLLMQMLGGRQFHNNAEVELALQEWLEIKASNVCCDRISKYGPRCVNAAADRVEK